MEKEVPKYFLLIISAALVVAVLAISVMTNPFSLLSLQSQADIGQEMDIEEDLDLSEEGIEDNPYAENVADYVQEEAKDQEISPEDAEGLLETLPLSILDLFNMGEMDEAQEQEEKEREEEKDESEEDEESTEDQEKEDEEEQEDQESDEQESEEEQEDEDTAEDDEQEQDEQQEEFQESIIDNIDTETITGNLRYIALLIALLAATIASYLVYSSDRDTSELLKKIYSRFANLVKTIPDLFSRFVVRLVNVVLAKIKSFSIFMHNLALKPLETIEGLKSSIKNRINSIEHTYKKIKEEGIIKTLKDRYSSTKETLKGIDYLWFRLKSLIGLETQNNLTPAEIRDKAIEEGLPEEEVEEFVDKFRHDKYSSKNYKGDFNLDQLKKWMEEQQDE